ncbi:ATP-binding protein [Reinekea blandensis]|uniref:histidine kinase n=1 Tax=Reinekea blandensis MED297 TaxID=314283 RepID=A4B9G9_9GAMM|nr:ATP-binding protein [Reinekea blandensis]EAR11270.1 sensor histidine kinase [Reinekea sp. MED297] [Reinekea blandensis MED297]
MNQLFTRLYLTFFASLLAVLALAALSVYLLADTRLQRFATTRLQPISELLQSSWSEQSPQQVDNWLALISDLTGVRWRITDPLENTDNVELDQIRLTDTRVTSRIRLDTQTAITADISDWQSLEQGYAWLFLDAISRESADRREARFITLRHQSPWPVERVTLGNDDLSALSRRRLSAGQSVRVEWQSSHQAALYLPAGDNRAIRFGPIPPYRFLSVTQWLIMIGASLAMLSLFFLAWVRPLDRRFRHLFDAVDRVSTTPDSVRLPTEASDELGLLARHVERMALGLIDQVEQNRQLNQAVSHDLKTPLARLRFSLELLDLPDDNPYRQNMNRDIEQLVQLTEELLLFHQLGSPEATPAPMDLTALTTERLVSFDSQGEITSELPKAPLSATIQPRHWTRLIDNLLSNAVQYGRGRVHLRLATSENGVRLSVEDNGPGMTAQQFEQLKEPFKRLDHHRNLNQQNHGLGLALVSAIAEHYHASFHYQTSPLGGATMIIDFPAACVPAL